MDRFDVKRMVRFLAVVATVGMFTVLVMGATVTNTGSEQGCGHSWPLCHGRLIPQAAVGAMIEFSHRAVVGVETVFILALAAGSWYLYGRRREIRILVPFMVVFLFLQAGLGAWAVMYPQVAAIVALHFGVSLVAFASVLLTALFVFEADGDEKVRDRPLPRLFQRAAWVVTGFSYVVVYLGAYVRHSDAELSCSGWPLCNGAVVPSLTGSVRIAVVHRVAAAVLVLSIFALAAWSRRLRNERPDLWRASIFALGAVLLQALSGAVVAWTRADLFSALAHAALAGLMFGSLAYLCMHVLPPSAVPQDVSLRRLLAQSTPDTAGARR